MYTYDSGIHSGANTCVPSVSSKGIVEEDEACGHQCTLKKTTICTQAVPQSQGLLSPNLHSIINCAKKLVSGAGGMKNWVKCRLHCAGRPLSCWRTGCHLG
ncbi:lysozyme-like protein 6 [Vicugna pacos]|uniref:Lysozyme-like protein 6 n=1 Tax=Vicugna pacos TaxID=30538 RepID=A0ABM5BJM1_VICPA